MALAKILWVDDEMESLQSQKLFLETKGYEVKTLTNGFDALDYVKENIVDVVLLDETRMGRLLKSLEGRTGLSQVFIVTDADESFKTMAQDVREVAGKVNPGLQVVQLYRDYLLNFMINKNQDRAAGQAGTQGARA